MSEIDDINSVALLYEKVTPIKKKKKPRDLDKEMEMRREAQDQAEERKKTGGKYDESHDISEWGKMASLYEAVNMSKLGQTSVMAPDDDKPETVSKQNLADFIFKHTNGGTEKFTVHTIRANDSEKDPTKKAGDVMVINGTLKIPRKAITGVGSTQGDAKERLQNHNTLTIYVTNLDGENYLAKYPDPSGKGRIRQFKLDKAFKLIMGGETYNIV